MTSLMDNLILLNDDEQFSEMLIEALIETGYSYICSDHIVAAYLHNKSSTVYQYLSKNRLEPEVLAKVILANIPTPEAPGIPPQFIECDSLEPEFKKLCTQEDSSQSGQLLIDTLSEPVKFILKLGGTLEYLYQAFSDLFFCENEPENPSPAQEIQPSKCGIWSGER